MLNVDCHSSLVEQVTLFAYGCIENTKVMPIAAMFVLTQFTDACTGHLDWMYAMDPPKTPIVLNVDCHSSLVEQYCLLMLVLEIQ